MAKFSGKVGYAETKETAPGIWSGSPVERTYYGDVLQNKRRTESGGQVNDNLNVNHKISIVADDYANQNFFAIRYVTWNGVSWKVLEVQVERPRLILTLGDVYNG